MSAGLAVISATVRALGPLALATLTSGADAAFAAGIPACGLAAPGCPAAAVAAAPPPAPAIVPNTTLSNVRLRALLSNFCITIGLAMVTEAPFLTVVVGTAAHVSPCAVFSRR